jgi:hypothetical protein
MPRNLQDPMWMRDCLHWRNRSCKSKPNRLLVLSHYTNSHLWSHWNQATPAFQQGRRLADQSSVEDHCLCAKGMQRMPQSTFYRLRSMSKMCAPPLQVKSGPLSGLNLSPIFPTPGSASPYLTYRFHKDPIGYHSTKTVDISYKYQQRLWDSHFLPWK